METGHKINYYKMAKTLGLIAIRKNVSDKAGIPPGFVPIGELVKKYGFHLTRRLYAMNSQGLGQYVTLIKPGQSRGILYTHEGDAQAVIAYVKKMGWKDVKPTAKTTPNPTTKTARLSELPPRHNPTQSNIDAQLARIDERLGEVNRRLNTARSRQAATWRVVKALAEVWGVDTDPSVDELLAHGSVVGVK